MGLDSGERAYSNDLLGSPSLSLESEFTEDLARDSMLYERFNPEDLDDTETGDEAGGKFTRGDRYLSTPSKLLSENLNIEKDDLCAGKISSDGFIVVSISEYSRIEVCTRGDPTLCRRDLCGVENGSSLVDEWAGLPSMESLSWILSPPIWLSLMCPSSSSVPPPSS